MIPNSALTVIDPGLKYHRVCVWCLLGDYYILSDAKPARDRPLTLFAEL